MEAPVPEPEYLRTLADGTVKQRNPFTGTEVWTVPGRANRPLGIRRPDPRPLAPEDAGRHCAFCERRLLETPPEKARVVRRDDGFATLRQVPASQLFATVPEFRRVPNLFEILSYDYWHLNHGHELPDDVVRARAAYLAEPEGLSHVLDVVGRKLRAAGLDEEQVQAMSVEERLDAASGFFGGGHDVVIARRHFVDGARDDTQLASSGTLSPGEHRAFLGFTVDAARALAEGIPEASYVAVFQNWLAPAGASFDHLHKQLVAIDERGTQQERALALARQHPDVFNEVALREAVRHGLVIAENAHAIAFAGFGHRYPTIEVYSRSTATVPWDATPEETDAMSDVLHAVHAATGADVPCNEEWHFRPLDTDTPVPWRIMLKWRVSTIAGFEGATKIYLNTIDPATVRARVLPRLFDLRSRGHVAPDLRIGDECAPTPDPLRYAG